MIKKLLIITLCLCIGGLMPAYGKDTPQAKITKAKKQVMDWGSDKMIWVETNTKAKLQGRIAEINDDSFILKVLDKDTIKDIPIRYDEVKKMSARDGGKAGKIVGYTALGVLAGVGTLFLITLGIWANN